MGRLSSQVVACAFALHFFFGSVLVLNSLGIGFFYYFPRKIDIIILDPVTDIAVWFLSVVLLSALASTSARAGWRRNVQLVIGALAISLTAVFFITQNFDAANKAATYVLFALATVEFVMVTESARSDAMAKKVVLRALAYLFGFFVVIEISSAVHYVFRAFDLFTSIGRYDAGIELQFSYLSYGLIPWLYVAFLFSWAWVPVLGRLLRTRNLFRPLAEPRNVRVEKPSQPSRFRSLTYLIDYRVILALAFAIFIGYYPYFHNPPWLVGTDTVRFYYRPLLRLAQQGLPDLLKERHPLMIALLYGLQLVLHTTAFDILRMLPTLLIGILALLTAWYVARGHTGTFALIAFAVSTLSMTTTVGVFASIFAGWSALLAWVLFFAYAAYAIDRKLKSVDLVLLLLISVAIFYLHPWTWVMFSLTATLTAIVTLLRDRRKGLPLVVTLIIAVAVPAVLGLLSLSLLKPTIQGSPPELYLSVIRNPLRLAAFWAVLTRLIQVWAPFFSPLYLATSILGVFCILAGNLAPVRRRLILTWICTSSIVSILAAPVGFDPARVTAESALFRVFFLTPFPLTASFGIAWLSQLPRLYQSRSDAEPKENSGYVRAGFVLGVVILGLMLAVATGAFRIIIFLGALPIVTGLALETGEERTTLSNLILMTLLGATFNYGTRALSQLLIDPHNDLRP